MSTKPFDDVLVGQTPGDLAPPRLLYRRPRPWALGLATRLSVPALLGLFWYVATNSGFITPDVFAAPQDVLRDAIRLWGSGVLQMHLAVSLTRALVGLMLGGSVGILLG